MQRILLASHGTVGAQAAEQAVIGRLVAGDKLFHLLVVPDFWDGMQGDDWLNNASTRDVFADYVEGSLEGEARDTFSRVAAAAEQRGVQYENRLVYGKPVSSLLEAVADVVPDVVVMGTTRPRHAEGLRSKMLTETLHRKMAAPLLVIPYPDA